VRTQEAGTEDGHRRRTREAGTGGRHRRQSQEAGTRSGQKRQAQEAGTGGRHKSWAQEDGTERAYAAGTGNAHCTSASYTAQPYREGAYTNAPCNLD
jgi:hypothetical protein